MIETQTPKTSELRGKIAEGETGLDALRGQLENFESQLSVSTADEEAALKNIRAGLDADHLTASANRRLNLVRIVDDVSTEASAAEAELDRLRSAAAISETTERLECMAQAANDAAADYHRLRRVAAERLADEFPGIRAALTSWNEARAAFKSEADPAIERARDEWKNTHGGNERTNPLHPGIYGVKVLFANELLANLAPNTMNVRSALPTDIGAASRPAKLDDSEAHPLEMFVEDSFHESVSKGRV